jgi:hypothetical protein
LFTPQFKHAIGESKEDFAHFESQFVLALNVLRQNVPLLCALLNCSLVSGLLGNRYEQKEEFTTWFSETLMLNLGDDEAAARFQVVLEEVTNVYRCFAKVCI